MRIDTQVGQCLAPAVAVDDDSVEAGENAPPESLTRDAVRRGKRSWAVKTDGARNRKADVSLRQCEPLEVKDVGAGERKRAHHVHVLDALQRQAQP